MGNKLSGRLKKAVVVKLDPKRDQLAAVFAEFMIDATFIPALASHLGFRGMQIAAIQSGLRRVKETHPIVTQFLDAVLSRFVPGKTIKFDAVAVDLEHPGARMLAYVENQKRGALDRGLSEPTIDEIVSSRAFADKFLKGRGNARTIRAGKGMTPDWAKKLIRAARKERGSAPKSA
jgi:hypothetical protein